MAKHSKTAEAEVIETPAPPTVPMTTMVVPTVTPAPVHELNEEQSAHFKTLTTKNAQMRYLNSLGWKNGPIAKYLSAVWGKTVIYQHVRNVLRQGFKKQS